MNPVTIAIQLIQLASQLAPAIREDLAKGVVTPAQQAQLHEAIDGLLNHGFQGPAWQVQPDPVAAGSQLADAPPAIPTP